MVWALVATGCARTTTERLQLPPLETVAHVDLARYVGTWYEIASFPQSFQRGCTATTAAYTLRPDGEIDVLNRCRQGSVDGREKTALGRARAGRDYLWILSRTPTMAEPTYQAIVARLQGQGYETSRLVRTLQVAGPTSSASSVRPPDPG
jgi:apolipoprotein D and lipocalin family protein